MDQVIQNGIDGLRKDLKHYIGMVRICAGRYNDKCEDLGKKWNIKAHQTRDEIIALEKEYPDLPWKQFHEKKELI